MPRNMNVKIDKETVQHLRIALQAQLERSSQVYTPRDGSAYIQFDEFPRELGVLEIQCKQDVKAPTYVWHHLQVVGIQFG